MSWFSRAKSFFSRQGSVDAATEAAGSAPQEAKAQSRYATIRGPAQQPVIQSAGYSQSGGVQNPRRIEKLIPYRHRKLTWQLECSLGL
ncbi:hypothetical protein WJX73_000974 [Symbiochloris irregularis]|uniref:Uncharacterized protein n=1 Tax=Symbiochloris irregularis TaxID=706552 RepID=A0AAW1NNH7_9CHLO